MTTLTTEPGTEPVLQVRELYLEDIPVLPVAEMPDELFGRSPDKYADFMTALIGDSDISDRASWGRVISELGPDAFSDADVLLEFFTGLMPRTSDSQEMLILIGGVPGDREIDVIIGEAAIDAGIDTGPRAGVCPCGYSYSECTQRHANSFARLTGTADHLLEL
jgi:hypothetical protein